MRAEENSEDETDKPNQNGRNGHREKAPESKSDKRVSSNIDGKFTGDVVSKKGNDAASWLMCVNTVAKYSVYQYFLPLSPRRWHYQ